MRSIRRSLTLWFLGLTVLTLGGVGWLVDNIVVRANRTREASVAEFIHKQHENRRHDELERVDQSLLDEARAISQSVQFLYADNFRSVSLPIRRAWETSIGFGMLNPLAAVNVAILATPGRHHVEYLSKRPLDDSVLNRVNDEEHFRDYFQVHTFLRDALKSKSLKGDTLPEFNRAKIDLALPNWLPADEVTLNDGTAVRRVVYATPIYVRQVGPMRRPSGDRPPGPIPERTTNNQPGTTQRTSGPAPTAPTRPPTTMESIVRDAPRIYVQTARPMSILQQSYAAFEAERDAELATLHKESDESIARTRGLLIALAVGAIGMMLFGSLILISRGLAPVNRLSHAVSQVSERDFRLPIPSSEMSSELLPVHQRITAALDALKRAFEREKQAVADISHELRTPVASLAATLDVSLRKPRTAEQYKTTLEECREINRQLGRLVERVMTLANIDSGNDRSMSLPCDVSDIARECVTVIRPLAEKHGLTVTADLPAGWQITTDEDKVREVLMNLLHNAVEYTPSGGQIVVGATQTAEGGVQFTVKDTGIGMTADVKDKIFERFYRADASRTATGVHAGLGLAIVKEYLHRLGGTVNVDSRPGEGSTFTVTIPSLSA